ncbi:MAG: leucyl aminopeptidase [Helicobacteraceae bacterium]|jgi:leucyl aminopeptidase|nr:leucyl aminopeptidase [Helicobacteraceae bacterium]
MKLEFAKEAKNAEFKVIFTIKKDLAHRFVSDQKLLEKLNYDGADESCAILAERGEIYVGVEDAVDLESFRIAAAKAIRAVKELKIKSAAAANYDFADRENCGAASGAEVSRAIAEGFLLGFYAYDRYKSKAKPSVLERLIFTAENYYGAAIDEKSLKSALEQTAIVCEGVNYARDLVNTPPDEMTPAALAAEAQEAARELKLQCDIYDADFLRKEKMGAFLAVSRASKEPPRLIHLAYKPKKPRKKVAIVGKGLTYDSGGLSLKPADYMMTMKADMAGGAAAIAIVKTAARLALPLEIHAIVGATENMIGGDAYKPDDILRAKNGKTIEVKNTDAEGRLVLADCLCYAQDSLGELDFLLDLATLTGACVVALGEYTSGVMGFNETLKDSLLGAADLGGELAAKLPFNRHLKKLIKSEIADITNAVSTRYGGAITAGLFLAEFIEEKNREKWAHLDIAGPSFVEKSWGANPHGASGAAVRWVTEFLRKL